jgi:hypothetical protein
MLFKQISSGNVKIEIYKKIFDMLICWNLNLKSIQYSHFTNSNCKIRNVNNKFKCMIF